MKSLAPNPCTCRGNIVVKLFVFALALVVTFAFMCMLLLPSILTGLIKKRTGFNATIQSLYVNPFTASVHLRQFNIDNPDSFPRTDFVSINEFNTAVEPTSFFHDRIVVRDALFDVAFVAMVKNDQGQTNIDVFKAGLHPPSPDQKNDATKPAAEPANKTPPKQFLIRHLVVKLDKIILADYSGSTPSVREIHLKIDRTFTDVTDLKQITVPLIADLSVAGVGDLTNILLGLIMPASLLDSLGVVTKDTGSVLKGTGEKAKNLFKGLFDSLEETPKK
jgi:uncharacterized protein involved in outer membrane biogenesis